MPKPKDRFHAYLDYCEDVEPVSVGDYIEQVARGEVMAWTVLMRDVKDTYNAGLLKKITLDNGGVAYIRQPLPDQYQTQTEKRAVGGIPNGHV